MFSYGRFQSAPHFSSEANAPRGMCQFPIHVSIRASLQQRGELTLLILARNFLSDSIRASLQQRGEPLHSFPAHFQKGSFNPRLTSAARRTKRVSFIEIWWFQSAPHFSSEANVL